MEFRDILIGGIAALATAFATYKLGSRKLSSKDKDSIISQLEKMMETKELQCMQEIRKGAEKIHEMEGVISLLEAARFEVPHPVWRLNMNREFVYVNEAALRDIFAPLGKIKSEVVGKKMRDVLPREFYKKLEAMDHKAMQRASKACLEQDITIQTGLPKITVLKVIVVVPKEIDSPIGFLAYAFIQHGDEFHIQ